MVKHWLLLILLIKSIVFYARGINYYNVDNNKMKTRHAEVDAIQKLKPYKNGIGKRVKQLYLLVIRTNKKGLDLMHSKPCEHCLSYVKKFSKKKGYSINKIYYINIDGILGYINDF